MIVIDDHKKITWSSRWIYSFPKICENFSYVNFNIILSSRVYKRPYILGQKGQFYYEMFSFLSKNILMEEASMLSERIFTTKIRKHWIRGNSNDLSQGLFIGLLLSWTKDGIFATVNIWGTKKLEILVKTKLSQMKLLQKVLFCGVNTTYKYRLKIFLLVCSVFIIQ